MRLKPEKIQVLAEQIYDALAANKDASVSPDRNDVVGLIKRVIVEDMQAEDALEEDARALLEKHMDEIQRKGMSFDKMLLKTKQQLARDRKMVI
ncbi:MAG: DUF507 family protein [Candidatus Sumerlaeia bacterium]